MNILVFSWRDPKHPLAGGAEQVMHEHMKGWVKAGHKVDHFSSRLKGVPRKERMNRINFIRCGYQYWVVQFAGFFYWLSNRSKYDLVVDQFHGIPFFTPLFVRKPKLAVLQEVAREVWFKNPLPWPLSWVIGTIGYFGEFFVFLLYTNTRFMVGSESAKDDLKKMLIPPRNVTIVPHGVIIAPLTKTFKKETKKTILFLGALTKDKGIEDALESFHYLNESSEYAFWVVGSAETKRYDTTLVKVTKKLGLEDSVKYWGGRDKVNNLKKFELLSRAHILVNPSIREGWGLVNIEANAVKTPVVAYNSPGLIDSVIDNVTGIICKKNTPSEMALEVEKLANDKEKYSKLQRNAHKWSSKFSWERSRSLSLKIIDDIVNP